MTSYSEILKKNALKILSNSPAVTTGKVKAEAPSNIAIVKYWGKYPGQIPANASLSMSLSNAKTNTEIDFSWKGTKKSISIDFNFEGKENPGFKNRILKYLESIKAYLPWLEQVHLEIKSKNTFPHSSGIASSASAMSTLALGLLETERKLFNLDSENDSLKKASFLARMGSGSAARSVYPGFAIWGKTASWKEASDEYAISAGEVHKDFENMHDSILIIESGQKTVSSSLGHSLMENNPYANARFSQAEQNMQILSHILREGDLGRFLDLAEEEALSLHAMMLTSKPGYILMKPNTLKAIQKIREFREGNDTLIGFTLDAGANVHVLYPESCVNEAEEFISSELKLLCEEGRVIRDWVS